jgi:hypothetical protein
MIQIKYKIQTNFERIHYANDHIEKNKKEKNNYYFSVSIKGIIRT